MYMCTSKNTLNISDRLEIPGLECLMHKKTLKVIVIPFSFPVRKKYNEYKVYTASQESQISHKIRILFFFFKETDDKAVMFYYEIIKIHPSVGRT